MELSNKHIITWPDEEKLTTAQIKEIFTGYLMSGEIRLLQLYDDYYESENTFISEKVTDKKNRDKTPNNDVPTAYYSTVVDTMAGFMFANVQYNPKTDQDIEFATMLNEILDANNKDVKEMKTGTYALAFNKGIELVYTTGDGNETELKYTSIDPRQAILIYDNKIEPDIFCMVWVRTAGFDEGVQIYKIDVIYKDQWQYYITDNKKNVIEREAPRDLFFQECPVVAYYTNSMSARSPFHKIIKYINALDYLITGNANDIEALTDALLILTKVLKEEDLKHLDELKAVMDIAPDDRAEYLTKNMDPAFREYASKLLIREIHKHSHTVDYFSPDTGMSGEVSGKALRIRLFDMDTYSKKIEKVYKLGSEKKVRLISSIMALVDGSEGGIDIIFNRTIPDAFEELAPVLNNLTFISDETKLEMLGLNAERELEKMEMQKEANMERMSLMMPENAQDEPDEENQDDIEQ